MTGTTATVNMFTSVTITWIHDTGSNAIPVKSFTVTGSPADVTGQNFSQTVGADESQVIIDALMLSPDTDYVATIRVYNLLGGSEPVDVLFSE